MDEVSSVYPGLNKNNETFRFNKINEIKDYFIEAELTSKVLSKYIGAFKQKVAFQLLHSVIGAPVGITIASLSSFIFLN